MYSAHTWPISANMLSFGNRAPDGGHIKDAPAAVWASQLRQVRELGFDYIDPTDAWVPLAALSDARIGEFSAERRRPGHLLHLDDSELGGGCRTR